MFGKLRYWHGKSSIKLFYLQNQQAPVTLNTNTKSVDKTELNASSSSKSVTSKGAPSVISSPSKQPFTIIHKDIVTHLEDGALPNLMVKQIIKNENRKYFHKMVVLDGLLTKNNLNKIVAI